MTDLLWSDPARNYGEESSRQQQECFSFNDSRRISFYYTYQAVCDFLQDNDLLSVIRAHEAKDTGYQMYRRSHFSKFPSLITIFSAPNYCDYYGNKAVVLNYSNGALNIKVFTLSSFYPKDANGLVSNVEQLLYDLIKNPNKSFWALLPS